METNNHKSFQGIYRKTYFWIWMYWDKALKSKTLCNKVKLSLPFAIHFCIDIDLSIQTLITCIVHYLCALVVT